MGIVTTNIAKNVLDRIGSVVEEQRNLDSSIDDLKKIVLSADDVAYNKTEFYYNTGRMSDGKNLRFSNKTKYFKFITNVVILQDGEESSILNMFDRASKELPSLIVYANGIKIPDNLLYVYPTNSTTDVLIPDSYIVDGASNELIIEKREYKNKEYIDYYSTGFSGTEFSFVIDDEQYRNSVINEKTTMVFLDGKLCSKVSKVIVDSNSTRKLVIIYFSASVSGDIEVFIDSSIKYTNSFMTSQSNKVGYSISESYIDSIHGPVSKHACVFFANGYRISNENIIQSGRLNFNYTFSNVCSVTCAIYVTDKDIINDSSLTLYGSDYYLYNMIGVDACTKALQGLSTGSIFDNNINFYNILNGLGTFYDTDHIDSIYSTFNSMLDLDSKVKYLLKDRPYLMRTFLEQYKRNEYTYTYTFNGTDEYIYLGLPSSYVKTSNDAVYCINIDNTHIPDSEITVLDRGTTDVFKVSSAYFNKGSNKIQIRIYPSGYSLSYEPHELSDIKTINGIFTITTSFFKNLTFDASDIIVLEKKIKDNNFIYLNTNDIGYKIKSDVTISVDKYNNITVNFTTMPTGTFLIYNKRFSMCYSYKKQIVGTYEDVFVPIYINTDNNPIPLITTNKLDVYAGKDKLIENIDYYYKVPSDVNSLTYTLIVLLRSIDPDTEINIYYSHIKNEVLLKKSGYFKNNNYGLFYIDIPYPVSLSYLNIYLNEKLLTDDDVDILSDNLIRVTTLENDMYDLCVETDFSVDYNLLNDYISIYKPDEFEVFIKNQFRGVNYTRTNIAIDDNPPDTNALYETFVTTVDSINRQKNIIARESEWYKYNENTTDCVTNNGTCLGGETIYDAIVFNGYLIVAGGKGRVACCNIATNTWYNYDASTTAYYVNDGSAMEYKNIYSIKIYDNKYLIVMGESGYVAYCNILTGLWTAASGTGVGLQNTYSSGVITKDIKTSLLYNDSLIVAGVGGEVATYNFTLGKWYPSSSGYTGKGSILTSAGDACDGQTIYGLSVLTVDDNDLLICCCGKGYVASAFISKNVWTKYDGTDQSVVTGPGFYSDGKIRNNKAIYSVLNVSNYLIFAGESGYISYYNTKTKKWYGSSDVDPDNLVSVGTYFKSNNINSIINYELNEIITGCDLGKIATYSLKSSCWYSSSGSSGIINDGTSINNKAIYKVVVFDSIKDDYFIFCGEGGLVCSYNVDVHEIPYRYDAYKTAFLKWYTTPGNARIQVPYNIPSAILKKFTIYKDDDETDWDIIVRSGDTDLLESVTMNECGMYPAKYKSRTRFIAEFIQSCENKRLTLAQYYELYLNSPAYNILYKEDIYPLKSGDLLDIDHDIALT